MFVNAARMPEDLRGHILYPYTKIKKRKRNVQIIGGSAY